MNTTQSKAAAAAGSDPALSPAVDVIEDAEGLTLYADLPGVPKDKLELTFESGALTIAGTIVLDAPTELGAGVAEVGLPRYRRVFALSKELDGERAAAEFAHGVLTVRIPKAAHAVPRRIEVRAA
jgi:HSP20 family molecular chaperone IbpA